MFKYEDLTNKELLKRYKTEVEDAYYHYDSEEQENAKKELPKIHNEILKRMS